jgi:hypothetical protein
LNNLVLGDEINFVKSKKVVKNLLEGVKILNTINGDIFMIIPDQMTYAIKFYVSLLFQVPAGG